jgi:hypothetical protein
MVFFLLEAPALTAGTAWVVPGSAASGRVPDGVRRGVEVRVGPDGGELAVANGIS